jgi:hypothetical protein
MLVLFAGLFTGLGAAETTAQNDSTRGTGPAIVPERSSAGEIGSSLAVKLAEVLNSTAMKQGYFVPVAEISATGRPGFEYYDPVSRSACFDSEGTYILHSGTNESVALFSSFVGSSTTSLTGLDPINTKVTRMIGRNESNWVRPQGYQSIQWTDLWSGVDLVYTGVPGGLKSQFWFDRESDYQSIAINISGAQALEVSADGSELTIVTSAGNVTENAWAWEQGSGRKIGVSYGVSGNIVSFNIDEEAEWGAIVLDPLLYSTFIGGVDVADWANDICLDDQRNAYITGAAGAVDFPTTSGAFNETQSGGDDVVVLKLNHNGSTLIYSTFIGAYNRTGSGYVYDEGNGICIDDLGQAYVTGYAGGVFPTTSGSFNESYHGGTDAFVLCLTPDGTALNFSGLLGGTGNDVGQDIALDPITGNVVVAGTSTSTNFQMTVGAYMTTNPGSTSGFVSHISSNGSILLYSTFLGGSGADNLYSLAINSTGSIYFAGSTDSSDLPTPGSPYDATIGTSGADAFYGCFSNDLSNLYVEGYIGGTWREFAGYITLNNDDSRVILVTRTESNDYPVTSGVYDESFNGIYDVAVSVLDRRLNSLLYSTFVGGNEISVPYHCVVDPEGNIYVVGYTGASDFPTTDDAINDTLMGTYDVFAFKITSDLQNLTYSTYLGGDNNDYGYGIDIYDPGGSWRRDIYLVGKTYSTNFPITAGAYDESLAGSYDWFVTGIWQAHPYPMIQSVANPYSVELNQNWRVSCNVTALNDVSNVRLYYNSTYFEMENTSTPEIWNWTVQVRVTVPGANQFQIWANGTLGNVTETSQYTFYVGDVPKFASISGDSAIAPAVPWTAEARVTDELIGDSGVASVQFRLDSGSWEDMTAEGDVYTADSRSFSEEGSYYWQLMAVDNVGNIAYSSSYKLVVSEETLPSTAAAAVVTTANGTPPWVDDYKADWGWWVYSGIFGAGSLMCALLFGKEEKIATVNALIIILTATAAGIMAAASLAGISRVFGWEIVAALWAGIGVWALAVAKKKLPAFAAGLALGSGALGIEMFITSGWNLAVAMYICLAAAGAVWFAGPKVKLIPKQRISIPVAVGVLMTLGAILGLWYVFV